MNIGSLREYIRSNFLKDDIQPYRWDDATLNASINEAQLEAVWRKRLIVDASIPSQLGSLVTQIAVTAFNSTYDLDPTVIFLRRAILVSDTVPLGAIDYRMLDRSIHGWEGMTGQPLYFVTGLDAPGQLKLRLFPQPISTDTAYLTVIRAPASLTTDLSIPEINERYHPKLSDWVIYRCYSSPDPDKTNPELSNLHLQRFADTFGTREQAEAEEIQMQRSISNPMAYANGTF